MLGWAQSVSPPNLVPSAPRSTTPTGRNTDALNLVLDAFEQENNQAANLQHEIPEITPAAGRPVSHVCIFLKSQMQNLW